MRATSASQTTSLATACPSIQLYCDVGHTVMRYDVTSKIVEPRSVSYDDLHHAYTDQNYFNFCAAGAATAVAYYWRPAQLTGRAGAYYAEPYGPHVSTTYWRASDTGTSSDTSDGYATQGRGYVMYIAEKTKPPNFSRPGLEDFDTYQTHGASAADIVYVLNWEISAHDPVYWQNYFYNQRPSSVSQATFVLDVRSDLFDYGAPVTVNLNTYVSSTSHLPNWSRSVGHTITIIGYDDSTSTFTYLDTCGRSCNGSAGNHNGGIYTVSYTTMYNLMRNWGTGYAG